MPTAPGAESVSIGDAVAGHAAAKPDALAVTCGDRYLSYRELDDRADRLVALLEDLGVVAGSRVAHLDVNAIEAVELVIACGRIGAGYLPLNWRLAPRELLEVLGGAEPAVLVVGPGFAAQSEELVAALTHRPALVCYGDPATAPWVGRERSTTRHSTTADDVVTYSYTSGTTGVPKGVMLTAGNIGAMTRHAPYTFKAGPDARILVALPLFHVGGLAPLLAVLHAGGVAVIVPKVVPDELVDTLERERVTSVVLVPTILQLLTEVPGAAERNWSHLKRVCYGGSPIPSVTLMAAMRTFGCEFAGLYGATESVATISWLQPQDHDPGGPREYLLRSVGHVLEHHQLQIVDPDGNVQPPGVVGEIRIRGPLVSPGYFRREAETQAVFSEDGWYRTGDAGHIDEDGYVYITDRVKDMIISGGENVYSIEVEEVLAKHPDVAQVAVVGLPHPKWVEVVAAVIVPRPGAQPDPADLVAFARRDLAGYKLPRVIEFVPEMPLNASGKIVKPELRRRFSGQPVTPDFSASTSKAKPD